MKKIIFSAFCSLSVIIAFAKPHLSEFRNNEVIIYFEGDIRDEDEPAVTRLQTQYLESELWNRSSYEWDLNQLGVKVTVVHNNPMIESENTKHYYSPPQRYYTTPQPSTPSKQ